MPDGYLYKPKIRSKFKKKSGGIVVIYRETLKQSLNFFYSPSEFVQWMGIDSTLLGTTKNILIGCVYIPPEGSKYASNQCFHEIENEMLDLSTKHDSYVSLIGDFNSRTKLLNEIIFPENELFEVLDELVDDDMLAYVNDYECLQRYNFPILRYSCDQAKPSNYGYKLIDFCKKNNLYIGNGRLEGNDFKIGAKTCKNASVVDYLLVSSPIIPLIKSFNILDFNPLYSDVHCCVQVNFHASLTDFTTHSNQTDSIKTTQARRWDPAKSNQFSESIRNDVMVFNELYRLIDNLGVNHDESDKHTVNTIVNKIGNLFIKSATGVFGVKSNCKKNVSNIFPKWFDKKCHEKRDVFHNARKTYNNVKNDENRDALNVASREYKRQMNTSRTNYEQKMEREMRDTEKSDPKKLWKILNSLKKNEKDKNVNIQIDQLFNYFKSLNSRGDDCDDDQFEYNPNDPEDPHITGILDDIISEDEILKAIKNLHNGKAASDDFIINEFLKTTCDQLMPIYLKLFNFILDTGIIPESWLTGIIKPVYKNKGDLNDLDNYRAICLTSNLGKVFTSIMNTRLNNLADEFDLITDAQGGFRKGYSTQDNIFVLHSLISLYLGTGKKLFCAFIDFRKAFDTVWRVGLFQKLIKNGIRGKVFRVIVNMYTDIKSCVQFGDLTTDFFPCEIGVRQGEKLSPFLFALYLNDLENFLDEHNVSNLSHLNEMSMQHIEMYIKLFLLLYADDTVIFAESEQKLQNALNCFEEYCKLWKLSVNVSKTKIVIFCKRKSQRVYEFKLFNEIVQLSDTYTYLGLIFNYTGTFCKGRDKLVEQSQKALYALYQKINNFPIPIDLQLKLFDALIVPILTYSSEIWGFEKLETVEKIHLQFCKKILGVRSTTPSFMVYGELGRFSLDVHIKMKMVCFWYKLASNENKLSGKMYRLLLNMYNAGNRSFRWINFIKCIFDDAGMSEIWQVQEHVNVNFIKTSLKQRLQDQFIQQWFVKIDASSRGKYYSNFKTEFGLEPYLLRLKKSTRISICKLRTCNIKLPIETGRWANTYVPEENRICYLCMNGLGDEYHYVSECTNDVIINLQNDYIPAYYRTNANRHKFYGMLKYCNPNVLNPLSLFIRKVEKFITLL